MCKIFGKNLQYFTLSLVVVNCTYYLCFLSVAFHFQCSTVVLVIYTRQNTFLESVSNPVDITNCRVSQMYLEIRNPERNLILRKIVFDTYRLQKRYYTVAKTVRVRDDLLHISNTSVGKR